jgi:hypothetical protein
MRLILLRVEPNERVLHRAFRSRLEITGSPRWRWNRPLHQTTFCCGPANGQGVGKRGPDSTTSAGEPKVGTMSQPISDPLDDSAADGRDHSGASRGSGLTAVIFCALVCYVGVFVMLYLDEVVLRTRFFDRWIPDSWHVPLRIVFYPLLMILHWLGWLPGPLPPLR